VSDYQLRTAVLEDWPLIVDFNQRLAAETEDTELNVELLTAGVRAALADSAKARYFVAAAGEAVVGQLMHTWEWSDWRNGMIWWLQSVYVEPEHRGRGVFRMLYDHVEGLAENDPGVVGIRLYVETENAAARAVYKKLGMRPGGYDVMQRLWRGT
jgi:ribosomal protein S18 acetylase RimI-like enzyme